LCKKKTISSNRIFVYGNCIHDYCLYNNLHGLFTCMIKTDKNCKICNRKIPNFTIFVIIIVKIRKNVDYVLDIRKVCIVVLIVKIYVVRNVLLI